MMDALRVAFCLSPSENWLGGVNYFENLLEAIEQHAVGTISPVVFIPDNISLDLFSGFNKSILVKTPLLRSSLTLTLFNKILVLFFGKNIFLEHLFRAHAIDVVSHCSSLGRNSSFPFLPWIPDFQHLYLPHLFSSRELFQRDRLFKQSLSCAPYVLVSSFDAKNHLCHWKPQFCKKARVLRFVSGKTLQSISSDPSSILDKYSIKRPFFLLPNQYWKHKNHILVLKAIHSLRVSMPDLLVISTGVTLDSRDKRFFESIKNQICLFKIERNYQVLGKIPYFDLSVLMRESIAIINPSLFEGWSTTVEEAKTLGKKLLLSNIAVHKEQAPDRAYYFDPHDHNQLACLMADQLANHSPEEESLASLTAQSQFQSSFKEFAYNYSEIIYECFRERET